MGALVAVMVMVSIGNLDWHSLRTLHRQPHGESLVMVTTVATVVATHDLAKGVIAGVLSALMFTRKIARYANMTSVLSEDGRTRTYTVTSDGTHGTPEPARRGGDPRVRAGGRERRDCRLRQCALVDGPDAHHDGCGLFSAHARRTCSRPAAGDLRLRGVRIRDGIHRELLRHQGRGELRRRAGRLRTDRCPARRGGDAQPAGGGAAGASAMGLADGRKVDFTP